jgi:cytochrome bd ubiquinol oxidase subunit II
MPLDTTHALAFVMLTALVLYALAGGADFGGGVWDLLASGPRRDAQRALIEKAIGPIWETNHVWLILVVVLLFATFPPAFAAITIALHVPLTLFLIGVVFRGSAFTFRAFDTRGDRVQKRWGLLFSLASVISPVVLGMMVGAIASGKIHVDHGVVTSSFFTTWLGLFPLLVGAFALSLFAFLAAVYLANEAQDHDLADDFRARALGAGALVGALALATFVASFEGAPLIQRGLTGRPWTWPLHLATAASALTAFGALWQRRYAIARVAAIAQTALILAGWAASQYPYLVVPGVTLTDAAANPYTQELVLIALAAGSVLLLPSLYFLFRIFKGKPLGTSPPGPSPGATQDP